VKRNEKYLFPQSPRPEAQRLADQGIRGADSSQGSFADEGGGTLQVSSEADQTSCELQRIETRSSLARLLDASLRGVERTRLTHDLQQTPEANREKLPVRSKRRTTPTSSKASPNSTEVATPGMECTLSNNVQDSDSLAPPSLKQKLVLVRRRLGYIQKRGHNEVHNYSYVTAADLAGAVGDILADLGVLVIPSLESISHDLVRNGSGGGEHLTHVVMNYSFVDVDTAEDITVKVAGEGVDAGDKAPYKAMTGALKYALLQSFLLATGDDPENERATLIDDSVSPTTHSEQRITTKELHELRQLIEDTNTELERVLAYYKLSSLEEMTAATYRRALELLKRKQAKQNRGENAHAQN